MHWLANGNETQVLVQPVSGKCLHDKSANRVLVRINGRHKKKTTAFLYFAMQLEHGTDEDNDPYIKFGGEAKTGPHLER